MKSESQDPEAGAVLRLSVGSRSIRPGLRSESSHMHMVPKTMLYDKPQGKREGGQPEPSRDSQSWRVGRDTYLGLGSPWE